MTNGVTHQKRRDVFPSGTGCFATLVVFAVLFVAPRCQAQSETPEAEADVPTAEVAVDGRALFRVRGVTALPAEQRAQAIADRIRAVAADPADSTNTLEVTESEGRSNIFAGDQQLLSIFDADASIEGVDRHVLAEVYRQRISQAIDAYRHERTPDALLRATLYALGATLVVALVLFIVIRVFRRLHAATLRVFQSKVQQSTIRSLKVLPSDSLWTSLSVALSAARSLAILVVFYLYADFVLGLYPWTRPVAQLLFGILLDPLRTMGLGILYSLPNLVFVAILAVVVRYGIKLLRLFFEAVQHESISFSGFDNDWAMPTFGLVRTAVIAFALVVAYPYLPGSQTDAFKGISLFLGVLLSLGSSSAIANLVAGYSLIYRRAFKVGDRVRIGDAFGDVAQSRLQVTHLWTIKNEEVIIPNSEILNSQVINYSSVARRQGLILHTTVGIGYETPWRQVEAMLLQAAERTNGLLREPPPFVLQTALGDFAVTYELNVYCDQPKAAARFYTDLHRNILDVFNEHGVQIMTPAYEGDPEVPKLVPKEKWFESPAAPPTPSGDGQGLRTQP